MRERASISGLSAACLQWASMACVQAAAVQEQQPPLQLAGGHETEKSQNIVYSHITNKTTLITGHKNSTEFSEFGTQKQLDF